MGPLRLVFVYLTPSSPVDITKALQLTLEDLVSTHRGRGGL